jgi:nitroimidazol reductase NimA-like FMN-containing flavoprotein (pyridoxamine 5'-phosphate oxidase superfamily)
MSQRTTVKRHSERAVPDEAKEILARGLVAHLGFSREGQPFVIPMIYQYEPEKPDRLYLHGSHASRALKQLASGAPVCVTVTTVQGLVYSRSAQYHSANYECVICFGRARVVKSKEEKWAVFERMIGRYHPGRTAGRDYEAASAEELMATAMVEVVIEEMSAKARRGGPLGPHDAEVDAPGTRGVVKLYPDIVLP